MALDVLRLEARSLRKIGTRRPSRLSLSALLLAPTLCAADLAKPTQPSMLVIAADGLGSGDIGVHGGKDMPTPHLDAPAAGGVRCTNGHGRLPGRQ
jgi:hypothetical protein